MSDMSSYTLNEEHDRILHQATNTPAGDPLPADVEAAYWSRKRVMDRIGGGRITTNDLAEICDRLGYGAPKAETPASLVELFERKELAVDTRVLATWRNKAVSALFKGVTSEGKVRVDIDGEVRTLAVDKVELAQEAA